MKTQTPGERLARARAREATRAADNAAWAELVAPARGSAGRHVDVVPTYPCDRCEHEFKWHLGPESIRFPREGSVCVRTVRKATALRRRVQCLCDGYVVKARRA